MEINIGEFIRTKKGDIGKVVYISNIANRKSYAIEWNKTKTYFISQIKDIKHSKNIIDLVEADDYVNGKRIVEVYTYFEDMEDGTSEYRGCSLENENGEKVYLDDIKSIVTKEQFKNVMYEI